MKTYSQAPDVTSTIEKVLMESSGQLYFDFEPRAAAKRSPKAQENAAVN